MANVNVKIFIPKTGYQGEAADFDQVYTAVMNALDWHFPGGYEDAGKAWAAHRQILKNQAAIEADLFDKDAELAAALSASPSAMAWESFIETARDAGQGVYDTLDRLGLDAQGRKVALDLEFTFVPGADAAPIQFTAVTPAVKKPATPGGGA